MEEFLEIRLLGDLRILVDGITLKELVGRRAEALLIYLVYTGEPHSLTALTDLLWDDDREQHYQESLPGLIENLQQQLGSYVLVIGNKVAFNRRMAYQLDVTEFERTLKFVREQLKRAEGLNSLVLSGMDKALALYEGDFLKGFYLRGAGQFQEWLETERRRLLALLVETLGLVIEHCWQHKAWEQGEIYASYSLQFAPLREATHRQMMRLLAGRGRYRTALDHYEKYQLLVSNSLDMAPEAATTDLYEAIQAELQRQLQSPVPHSGKPAILLPETDLRDVRRSTQPLIIPAQIGKLVQLKRVSFFSTMPDHLLGQIAGMLDELEVPAGQELFHEGDAGNCMYMVVSGRAMVHSGSSVIGYLEERDIFGEMALLDDQPRMASVTILEDARLWRLDQDALYSLMASHIEVARAIVGVLSSRLRAHVRALVKAGRSFEDSPAPAVLVKYS